VKSNVALSRKNRFADLKTESEMNSMAIGIIGVIVGEIHSTAEEKVVEIARTMKDMNQVLDAKKASASTEAQGEIYHLNCIIDPEKVESFKRQWNSIDVSKVEPLVAFPLTERGPKCRDCKCFNCGELIECRVIEPSALLHCASLCIGLYPIESCKYFDKENDDQAEAKSDAEEILRNEG